jgi:hypothetical protein
MQNTYFPQTLFIDILQGVVLFNILFLEKVGEERDIVFSHSDA